MKKLLYILPFLTLFSCKDTVYSDYEDSPIKSVECRPMFMPLAASDGTLVTITADTADNTYNFIKIDKNAKTTGQTIKLSWNMSDRNAPNQGGEIPQHESQSKQSTTTQSTTVVDISEGQFRKNSNDEFFLDFYSTNDFGREYYAVVKFDKDCNIIFQHDSTVNAMGGGMGSGQNQTVNKLPIGGTPLNNGGYAMILQTPTMGMMQNSSYDLSLRYINSGGEIEKTSTLSFSENISIVSVNSVDNNVIIFYKNSDETSFVKVFTIDGTEVNSIEIPTTFSLLNFLTWYKYGYISGYNSETKKFIIAQINSNGEFEYQKDMDSVAVFVNITEVDNQLCLTGFNQPSNTTLSSIEAYMNYISELNGIIVMGNLEEKAYNTTMADYGCGVIVYAVFNDSDGYYTVFLTRVTPLDLFSQKNTTYGGTIYIYKTNDIKNLQIN